MEFRLHLGLGAVTTVLGPVRIGGGELVLFGAPQRRAHFRRDGAYLESAGRVTERIPEGALTGINGVRVPTRSKPLGWLLLVLGWFVPAGTANAEPPTVQVNFGVAQWGWNRYVTWDLGRPSEAPFDKHVARQVEFWMAQASALDVRVLVDEGIFARFVEFADDSWRQKALRRAFVEAVGGS